MRYLLAFAGSYSLAKLAKPIRRLVCDLYDEWVFDNRPPLDAIRLFWKEWKERKRWTGQ